MLRSIIFVHMSKYIYATEFILGFQFTYFTNKGKKKLPETTNVCYLPPGWTVN